LVDNVQEVHNNREIIDGHCRVHRVLKEKGKKKLSIAKLRLVRLMQSAPSAAFQKARQRKHGAGQGREDNSCMRKFLHVS